MPCSRSRAGLTWRRNLAGGTTRKIAQYWMGAQTTLVPDWYLAGTLYLADFADSDDDPKNLTLMLSYLFAKRTDAYVTLGHAWDKGSSNMGVTGFGNVVAGSGQTGVALGLCHKF